MRIFLIILLTIFIVMLTFLNTFIFDGDDDDIIGARFMSIMAGMLFAILEALIITDYIPLD